MKKKKKKKRVYEEEEEEEEKKNSKNNINNIIIIIFLAFYRCLYFEERKFKDLYLWAARTPDGPSVKFHVQNIHTMDELKMTYVYGCNYCEEEVVMVMVEVVVMVMVEVVVMYMLYIYTFTYIIDHFLFHFSSSYSGNCLKGSRPVLSFDQTFQSTPFYQVWNIYHIYCSGKM